MSADDDRRMIVETETVQTPAPNLLPVQQEENSKKDEDAHSVSDEATANLIDHNPLSIHTPNAAVRSKKSSLLIDSFLGKEPASRPAKPLGAQGAKNKNATMSSDPGGSGVATAGVDESIASSAAHASAQAADEPSRGGDSQLGQEPQVALSTVTTNNDDLVPDSDHTHRRSRDPPAKKADFFAARLASAVGENEISDSEETFVYESTANSTNNGVAASSSADPRPYGIPPKMSAPLLNNGVVASKKLLNRAKGTRHTSIAAIPHTDHHAPPQDDTFSVTSASKPQTAAAGLPGAPTLGAGTAVGNPISPAVAGAVAPTTPSELKSERSRTTLHASPGKRLSLLSLAQNGASLPNRAAARKISTHSAAAAAAAAARRKKPLKRQLRTTASKIFDAHGASLRRYSGVPDDINLEDYIEQTGGELTPNRFAYRSDSDYDDDALSYIHNADNDEEDAHSMFYYQHPKPDLEARHAPPGYPEETVSDRGVDDYTQMALLPEGYFYHSATENTPLRHKNSLYSTGYSPHNFYTKKSTWVRLKNFFILHSWCRFYSPWGSFRVFCSLLTKNCTISNSHDSRQCSLAQTNLCLMSLLLLIIRGFSQWKYKTWRWTFLLKVRISILWEIHQQQAVVPSMKQFSLVMSRLWRHLYNSGADSFDTTTICRAPALSLCHQGQMRIAHRAKMNYISPPPQLKTVPSFGEN
ncbi:LAMI_0C07932g1_1 [Lachancea mirantina]|uniref:LAMI_0C07932g1_1 n=1 Tax=Lachancea mirantina TaxID=1230905 RepID=A0A1G4J4C0_9SACH|nr:LAMI_0C07932g1_1 [Lachancea mirantina]